MTIAEETLKSQSLDGALLIAGSPGALRIFQAYATANGASPAMAWMIIGSGSSSVLRAIPMRRTAVRLTPNQLSYSAEWDARLTGGLFSIGAQLAVCTDAIPSFSGTLLTGVEMTLIFDDSLST